MTRVIITDHTTIRCGNVTSFGDIIPQLEGNCLYCDCVLRPCNNELCTPCNDLYKKKIIRRDCGHFRKNTKGRRLEILSDVSSSSLD